MTPPAGGDGSVLRAGAVTDVGRTRQINQDAPLVADELQLWAVADGMGGHQGGEVASELAVTNLRRSYELGEGRTLDTLLDAAAGANSAVYDASREDPDLAGMGTTLVAIARTDDDELAYVSVGDSRIYLLRDGELTRLTVDHSLVEELVREGAITPEEARTHPRRNVVTRVLGIDPFVQVDSDVIIPYSGDRYVLCSDGLFNEVEHDTMASVLRRLADPADAASELVRLANENGGHDNITVLVLDVVDDDDRAGKASATIGVGPVDDMAGFSVIRASESEPVEATGAVDRRQGVPARPARQPAGQAPRRPARSAPPLHVAGGDVPDRPRRRGGHRHRRHRLLRPGHLLHRVRRRRRGHRLPGQAGRGALVRAHRRRAQPVHPRGRPARAGRQRRGRHRGRQPRPRHRLPHHRRSPRARPPPRPPPPRPQPPPPPSP